MYSYIDNRGSVTSIKEIPFEVKEILISKNNKYTLRGLHQSPYKKRVHVLKGRIYDFFINIYTGEKKEIVLEEGSYIDIPEGFAHGFYSYVDSEILYLLGGKFDPSIDITIYWNDPSLLLERAFSKEYLIVSEKDKGAYYSKKYDFFLLGSRGFLGSNCLKILKSQGYSIFESNERLSNLEIIREQIIKSRANYIICAAGISGKPTIEWCETHEEETYSTNFLGMVDLMRMTNTLNLHCTLFGSGLVYTGDKTIYTEEDTPNLQSKVYPKWRVELEKHVPHYKNVLYLRILYPVTLDGHPKCFMTKMVGRAASVNNTKVSITVVPELFYFLSELSEKKKTGVLNFVNKNTILLKDLLEIYSKYKDPLTITLNNQIEKVTGYELSTDKLSLNTTSKICDIKESIISYYLKGVCT